MFEGEETKRQCKKCLEFFPETSVYFGLYKNGDRKGLRYVCRTCSSIQRQENRDRHPERFEWSDSNKKECKTCLSSFPATPEFFEICLDSVDGLKGYCRDCRFKKYRKRKFGYLDCGVPKRHRVYKNKGEKSKQRGKTTYESFFSKYTPEEKTIIRKHQKLMESYNMSLEEYQYACLSQEYKCGICGEVRKKFPSEKKRDVLYVDHDHATGKIRGLVCSLCNVMLGNARDSVDILSLGIKYLLSPPGIRKEKID